MWRWGGGGGRGHQDVQAQGGPNQHALLLPQHAVGGDQAGPQDGQVRLVGEPQVLLVQPLLRLRLRGAPQWRPFPRHRPSPATTSNLAASRSCTQQDQAW